MSWHRSEASVFPEGNAGVDISWNQYGDSLTPNNVSYVKRISYRHGMICSQETDTTFGVVAVVVAYSRQGVLRFGGCVGG
jgi:hypothetical protein